MVVRSPYLATFALALLVLAGCGSKAKPVDVQTWAARTCAAEQRFTDAITASRDTRDPQSLDLNERKQRAERLGRAEVDAANALAKDLRAIEPPAEASNFHKALIAHTDELSGAINEQVEAIKKATAPQDIGVANASARFRLDGAEREVVAARSQLPDSAVQALQNQPQCGEVPAPGPPPASVTPSV